MTFAYTHHFTADSTALAQVYYNQKTQELVLITHNNTFAGYVDVPLNIYEALVVENDSRTGSLGRYWNQWIKSHFKGFDTSWITRFEEDSAEPVTVQDNTSAEEVPAFGVDPVTLREFSVGFNFGDDESNTLIIYADGPHAALDKVHEIAQIAGWDNLVVTFLSRED